MKKVAVLRCLITSAGCAGTGCLKAFNTRTGGFCAYGDEPLELEAVWTCNGCGNSMLENQEGIQKKIDRMEANGIEYVHLSACTNKMNAEGVQYRCPKIVKIAEALRAKGITIVEGTHEKTLGTGEGQSLPKVVPPLA